ncbi:MAG: N-acetylmuramoyl-L-alanine amidase [Sphingobacteriaceae bacterium]|nr:MAG: N-acetylmuramoyl-L-alanine amidase [Sphingobacteriaceae bacterium]
MKSKTLKSLIYFLTIFSLFITTTSFIEEKPVKCDTTTNSHFKLKTIVVDAGHGGRRTGASGAFSLEKDVTLAIAFKLQKAIQKQMDDIKVVMTRTNGEDVDWQKEEKAIRENIVEADASEMNSKFDPTDPTSVILMNAYKNKFRRQSIHFADLVNKEFVETDARHSNGVIEQGVLVLCHSAMLSILV